MWHSGKEFTCQFKRCKFILWVRKIPGKGNGNPLEYSCLENSMDRAAWWATVHGVAESDMTERKHKNKLWEAGVLITNYSSLIFDSSIFFLANRKYPSTNKLTNFLVKNFYFFSRQN